MTLLTYLIRFLNLYIIYKTVDNLIIRVFSMLYILKYFPPIKLIFDYIHIELFFSNDFNNSISYFPPK